MSYRNFNPIPLIAYGLDSEKNNLYDDVYGKEQLAIMTVHDNIESLKLNTQDNFLKIGRMLLNVLNHGHIEGYTSILNEIINIKKNQAIKYIDAYNYANLKYQSNQPIESCLKLGIEKLFLITRLESQDKREKLEKFVLDNELTVRQLNSLVKVLNGKSEILELAKQFEELTNTNNET